MLALLLTHAAALALYWYAPRFWAAKDAAAFLADGSADSLHDRFHRQRATWRAAFLLLLALAASEPLRGHWWAFTTSFLALVSIGAAYFFYDFNPRLNRARGLPEYYVSTDPNAALFPDRWIWARSKKVFPNFNPTNEMARREWESALLHRLTIQVLEAGSLLYLALLAATYLLQ